MQVLRVGGGYLAAREHATRRALVVIVGAGAIGVAALSVGVHPLAGILLAVTIASTAAKVRRRARWLSKGIDGEALVTERLRDLSDEYFLLNDVVLPGHPGNIDHVVIGPCGVVVIETKNFTGLVESHGNAWLVNSRQRRSVSKQVNRGAIAVREALSRAYPDLQESVLRFVESIAVFTNPSSRVKVDRAKTIVARYSQLLDVILSIARGRRVPPAVAARLAKTLLELTSHQGPLAAGQ